MLPPHGAWVTEARPEVANSAIQEENNVEFNSLANGQRMKTNQNWCDVISSEGSSNESRRRILLM